MKPFLLKKLKIFGYFLVGRRQKSGQKKAWIIEVRTTITIATKLHFILTNSGKNICLGFTNTFLWNRTQAPSILSNVITVKKVMAILRLHKNIMCLNHSQYFFFKNSKWFSDDFFKVNQSYTVRQKQVFLELSSEGIIMFMWAMFEPIMFDTTSTFTTILLCTYYYSKRTLILYTSRYACTTMHLSPIRTNLLLESQF